MDAGKCTDILDNGKNCTANGCQGDCEAVFGLPVKGQCISKLECQCTYPC